MRSPECCDFEYAVNACTAYVYQVQSGGDRIARSGASVPRDGGGLMRLELARRTPDVGSRCRQLRGEDFIGERERHQNDGRVAGVRSQPSVVRRPNTDIAGAQSGSRRARVYEDRQRHALPPPGSGVRARTQHRAVLMPYRLVADAGPAYARAHNIR